MSGVARAVAGGMPGARWQGGKFPHLMPSGKKFHRMCYLRRPMDQCRDVTTHPRRAEKPKNRSKTQKEPNIMRTYSIASLIPSFRSAVRRGLTTAFLAALAVTSADAQRRPTISSFTPSSGPTTTVVTITGTNFNRDTNGNVWTGAAPYSVHFGGSGAAKPTVLSNTRMRVSVPASATSGPIRLRAFGFDQQQISRSSSNFTLTQVTRPAITSFSPTSGPVGTQITITGTNFHRDSVGNVWSGSVPFRVEFYNLGTV
ncbi:MAG: hypothetical protein EOP85_04435, partial [Verrucomicrobiaceae bacterium]